MKPIEFFHHCPRCGVALPPRDRPNAISCPNCQFLYFFNPASAVGAFVRDDAGRLLFLRRAVDPAKGKLGVPGGFIDLGESAEDALRREVREETGLELDDVKFVGSWPNRYLFRDIEYPVLDLYFAARARTTTIVADASEVTSTCWLSPTELADDEIAFPSLRLALRQWQARQVK